MGQNNSRESDTINWNQINTNEMSSTIPNMNNISIEAKELISRLTLPEISDSNSEFNSNNIFTNNLNNFNEHKITEYDVSSPFISSEMYNYLVNKHTNTNMLGGAPTNNNDDSDTSATSSSLSESGLKSSPSETEVETKVKSKNKKKKTDLQSSSEKKTDLPSSSEKKTVLPSESNHEGIIKKKNKKISKTNKKKSYRGTEEYLSYVSSSAHTNGSLSDTVANENNYTISTVNTSDINMISE